MEVSSKPWLAKAFLFTTILAYSHFFLLLPWLRDKGIPLIILISLKVYV